MVRRLCGESCIPHCPSHGCSRYQPADESLPKITGGAIWIVLQRHSPGEVLEPVEPPRVPRGFQMHRLAARGKDSKLPLLFINNGSGFRQIQAYIGTFDSDVYCLILMDFTLPRQKRDSLGAIVRKTFLHFNCRHREIATTRSSRNPITSLILLRGWPITCNGTCSRA